MDKETLGHYGWIVVVILVLSIMIALATPFAEATKGGVVGAVNNFGGHLDNALNSINGGGAPNKATEPGLYKTGSNYTVLLKPWDQLITEGILTEDGIPADGQQLALEGDLVFSNEITSLSWSAFSGCKKLTGVIIPENLTDFGYGVFSGCTNLEYIEFPSTFQNLSSYTFDDCTSLKTVIMPVIDPLPIGGTFFDDCPSDLIIYVPAESVETYKNDPWWSGYADQIQAIPAN